MAADWSILVKPSVRPILDALLAGPRTLTELSSQASLSKPALLRHLNALSEMGVIRREEMRSATGREVRFAAEWTSLRLEIDPRNGLALSWAAVGPVDPQFPLTAQIKDPGVREEVAGILRKLPRQVHDHAEKLWKGSGLIFVVIFGSVARGEVTWKSDIDLLLVFADSADSAQEDWADAIAAAQPDLRHAARPRFVSRSSFLKGGRTIEDEAAREGIIVLGPRSDTEVWKRMARYKAITI